MAQFYTDEYINENYPDHCRTSCSDARPNINATVNGHGCLRCNALLFQREEWQQTVVAAAKNLRAQKGRHNTEIAYTRLMHALDDEPTHNAELKGASQLAGAASRSNAGLGEEG